MTPQEANDGLAEYMQAEFNSVINETLEQALRYRFKDENMSIIVKDNVVTFSGNTKYSEEELRIIVNEVRQIDKAEQYINSQIDDDFIAAKNMAVSDLVTYGFITDETQALIDKLKTK